MTREELRVEALRLFKDNNNIAIQAATGVGKSKIAIEMLNYYIDCVAYKPTILFVVAEVAHKANWEEEIKKWGLKDSNHTIICYASLKKFKNTSWDVIVFDEAHHLDTAARLDAFDSLRTYYRIFLSATLKDSLLYKLEESCGPIETLKMGLQDAFDANILPEPKIVLIPLELNKKDSNLTIVESWGTKGKKLTAKCTYQERWKYIRQKKSIPNGELQISCTQWQYYNYLTEQFEYYKKRFMFTRNEAIKNKWLQWGSKRKIFLGEQKTAVVMRLLEELKDKRYICFCTNIEQAEILGGENCVHSKKRNSLSIIDKFNTGKINNLFAVGMLTEGMNLNNIEAGVIVQLDGEERAFIQKFGRTLRADSPVQYIFYFKDTRDKEYLEKALEGIDKKYIKIYEIYNR